MAKAMALMFLVAATACYAVDVEVAVDKERPTLHLAMLVIADIGAIRDSKASDRDVAASEAREPRAVVDIAYDVAQREMKPEEWKKFVKKIDGQYKDYESQSNACDLNTFLNDRLLQYAFSATSGTRKSLSQFVFWLALYKEYRAEPPSYIQKTTAEQREKMETLLKDFSWEKLAELMKMDKAKDKKKNDETADPGVSESKPEQNVTIRSDK